MLIHLATGIDRFVSLRSRSDRDAGGLIAMPALITPQTAQRFKSALRIQQNGKAHQRHPSRPLLQPNLRQLPQQLELPHHPSNPCKTSTSKAPRALEASSARNPAQRRTQGSQTMSFWSIDGATGTNLSFFHQPQLHKIPGHSGTSPSDLFLRLNETAAAATRASADQQDSHQLQPPRSPSTQ